MKELPHYGVLVGLLVAAHLCHAQQDAPEKPVVEARYSQSGKRMVFVDGKPFVVFGAFNVTDVEELDAAKEMGVNTIAVNVPWTEDTDYRGIYDFAQSAGEKGIRVVLSVSMVPPPQDAPTFAISPVNFSYDKLVRAWIKYVVDHFRSLPNLLGYATQNSPGAILSYTDADFQTYLRRWYTLPENLNQSWRIQVTGFNAATMEVAQTLDDSLPVGFARSSLDVLIYKWTALTELMRTWAQEFRLRDKNHLVLTGLLHDYKTIISVPDNYDGIIPATFPTVAGADTVAHNCHAIDMARRANQFVALPCLLTAGGPGVLNANIREGLPEWVNEAFVHGASGVWLADWKKLRETDKSSELATSLKERFSAVANSSVGESPPTPTVAFLYEPLGEGIALGGNPLYGFSQDLSIDEPSFPFLDFRRGTKFGQVDYLSHDSLMRVDLTQYGTIIAPFCLWLSPEAEESLARYVDAGGVLLADFGIGMGQSGGTFVSMSPTLQRVFGVWGINRLVDQSRNLTVFTHHELFPSLEVGMMTTGSLGGVAFARPIGLVRLYGETVVLGWAVRGSRGSLREGAGVVTIHPFGKGHGVYAPFRLWSNWRPQDRVYPQFHSDLLQRNALVALKNDSNLFPSTVAISAMSDGVAVENVAKEMQYAQVEAMGASNFLFADALTQTWPLQLSLRSGFIGARGGAWRVPHLETVAPQAVTLHMDLQPGELRYCPYVPVQLTPLEKSALARVTRYGSEGIDLQIFGAVRTVGLSEKGNLDVTQPTSTLAELTIHSGGFPIHPHGEYLISIKSVGDKNREPRAVTADANGRIVIKERFQSDQLTIRAKAEPSAHE